MSEEIQDRLQFRTQNQQLAGALLDIGCELARQDQGGPADNLYTIGFLRDRKIGVGKPIETAVREAVRRKIPGIVTYVFKRSAKLEMAIKTWDDMVEERQKADHDSRPPIFPKVSDENVVQTIYVHALNREAFLEIPWFTDPLISTVEVKSTRSIPLGEDKPAPRTVMTGRGKVWRLNSDKKIKDHLKI